VAAYHGFSKTTDMNICTRWGATHARKVHVL